MQYDLLFYLYCFDVFDVRSVVFDDSMIDLHSLLKEYEIDFEDSNTDSSDGG